MSGLVRSVKKVFKRVAENRVVKGLAIAAALYYTAGLAGGAMGNTTMASLPGIKGAADLLGVGGMGAFGNAGPPDAGLTGGGDMPGLQTTPLADTSAPAGTDLTPGPNASMEMGQASAPGASAPGAQAPVKPPSAPPAPAAVPTPAQPGQPGVPTSKLSWWQNLSPAAQQILAQGFAGGAAGMMQALAAKSASEDAEARENRQRDDKIRRGSVPDFSSGIINRARSG